jgi:hypothetical protein
MGENRIKIVIITSTPNLSSIQISENASKLCLQDTTLKKNIGLEMVASGVVIDCNGKQKNWVRIPPGERN